MVENKGDHMPYKLEYTHNTKPKTRGVQFYRTIDHAIAYMSRQGDCSATLTKYGKKYIWNGKGFDEVES
jgi:hypothetical protein